MDYIIKRQEAEEIKKGRSWLLVYGRRKVGKTFMLKILCRFRHYFLVKRSLDVLYNEKSIPIEEFKQTIKRLLEAGKTAVVDEFQRLGEDVLEEIATFHPNGRLILSGSSMRVVKRVFEPKSPLLGFFTPLEIKFIRPSDIIRGLKGRLSPQQLIEIASFIREPWMVPIYAGEGLLEFVYNVAVKSKYIITSLVGEIFTEEERELTKKYQALISLIGSGVWNAKQLTSIMYANGLIPEPSPTNIIQYIKNLEGMGMVESIKMYRSKSRYYRLVSPLMNIYYYLDSRYNIGEREVSLEEVKPTLRRLVSMEIQNFVADSMAELFGGRKEYFNSPEKEIDFIITVRNKPGMVGEVKWKRFERVDMERFRLSSEGIQGRKMLFVKTGKCKDRGIETIGAEGLARMIGQKK